MWPFKKKEIHNPDCYMCADPFNKPGLPKSRCSRLGCNQSAAHVVFHWASGWARFSYLCQECFKEHNAWFYGTNEWGKEPTEGWLFTPPEGVVLLPPIQHEPPAPDPRLMSTQTRTGTIRGCGCNCP